MSLTVDDQNPLIFKSSRGWTNDNNANPNTVYQGTLSYSWTAGAYQTIRFTGTSITVMGWLDPLSKDNLHPVVAQFTIDDGAQTTYNPRAPSSFTKATYYQSPQLPMGEHVLRITNMRQDDVVEIDYFIIRASSGTPQILKSDGSPRPSPAPPISTPVARTSPSPSIQTSSSSPSSSSDLASTSDTTPSTSDIPPPQSSKSLDFTMFHPPRASDSQSSGISPSNSASATNANTTDINPGAGIATLTSNTSGAPPVITTYQSTVLNASSESSAAADRRLIAAVSCGVIFALLALILAAIMLYKRHRRKQQSQRTAVSFNPIYSQAQSHSESQSHLHSHSQSHSHSHLGTGMLRSRGAGSLSTSGSDSVEKPLYSTIADWSVYAQPTIANSTSASSRFSMESPVSTVVENLNNVHVYAENNAYATQAGTPIVQTGSVTPVKKYDAFLDRSPDARGEAGADAGAGAGAVVDADVDADAAHAYGYARHGSEFYGSVSRRSVDLPAYTR